MFGKFFRKKFRKRLDNDVATLESYAAKINAAKELVDDAELLEKLDKLQNDLHYNLGTGSKSAKGDLSHITNGIDKILKMLRSDNWDKETVLKKIKLVSSEIRMHSAHNIK